MKSLKMKFMGGIVIGILVICTSIFVIVNSSSKDYSSTISYKEATDLITQLNSWDYDSSFEFWDIQKIDEDLYLVSQSTQVVEDINLSEHSWIVDNKRVVYEIFNGKIINGEDLDVKIASNFSHQLKTKIKDERNEVIPFESEKIKSNRIKKGEEKIIVEGEDGEMNVITELMFVDGVEVDVKEETVVI